MSQISPFLGSAIQASDVQRAQATDKDRHLQHSQDLKKNAGLSGDRFEHAVESSEEIDPIHDEQKQDGKKKRQSNKHPHQDDSNDEDQPRLDLTA